MHFSSIIKKLYYVEAGSKRRKPRRAKTPIIMTIKARKGANIKVIAEISGLVR